MTTKNKIFTDKIMSDLKRISSTDARPISLKHMLLKVAVRCAELESDFRELEAEVRTKKASS